MMQNLQKLCKFYAFKSFERNYARWSHRKPLKVILPKEDNLKFEEKQLLLTPQLNEVLPKKTNYKQNKGEITYTKLKNHDPVFTSVITLIKSKRHKEKQNLILLEGKRIIREALECGCKLKYLVFSRKEDLNEFKSFLPTFGVKIFKMPYNEIQMWSDLTTSPGLLGLFSTPNTENIKSPSKMRLTVVCDNVREPGNLGAILRTSAGAGCSKVLLSKGCVDLWDPKVLRSASGGHFRIPIFNKCTFDDILNKIDENSDILLADAINFTNTSDIASSIPILPYYNMKIDKSNETVLVIGGETHGLSEDAYEMAAKLNGLRIHIPLDNNVESLNSGTSLGIIAFEIKRQVEIANDSQFKISV